MEIETQKSMSAIYDLVGKDGVITFKVKRGELANGFLVSGIGALFIIAITTFMLREVEGIFQETMVLPLFLSGIFIVGGLTSCSHVKINNNTKHVEVKKIIFCVAVKKIRSRFTGLVLATFQTGKYFSLLLGGDGVPVIQVTRRKRGDELLHGCEEVRKKASQLGITITIGEISGDAELKE